MDSASKRLHTMTPGSEDDLFSWMFMNPLFPVRVDPIRLEEEEDNDDELFLENDDTIGKIRSLSNTSPHNNLVLVENITTPSTTSTTAPSSSTQLPPPPPLLQRQQDDNDDGDDDDEGEDVFSSPPPNGEEKDDARAKRLEKNREIARNCRKRKREKQQALEEEVAKLREWNSQLEIKLQQIHPETLAREIVRKEEVEQIYQLSLQSQDEDQIQTKLDEHKEVYADFGKERKQAIGYHLEQLKILLLPNQVSKMTLFALQQEDAFYDEEKNKLTFGGGIWNLLCEELKLTAEQKNTLLNMRSEIRSQRQNVSACLHILKKLEAGIKENLKSSVKQLSKVQKLTTPSQQAKFLWWIEKNQSQAELLNNIWEQKNNLL